MNTDKIIEALMYVIPSLITGGVAYLLFERHFKDQENSRRWILQRENQKHALPLRLQAYERLALFLERINPAKLLIRVAPLNSNKADYQNLLIHHIEQEYEHNMTQQIYVSDELWITILKAKNTVIQSIRKTTMDDSITDADKLREKILSDLLQDEAVTSIALSFLKNEIKEFL